MKRVMLLALVCCGCAAARQQATRDVECVYAGEAGNPKTAPLVETETFGPSTVIWLHDEASYLIVRDRHLYRCPAG